MSGLRKLLMLKAAGGKQGPGKNLLNVLDHDTTHGIPEAGYSNGAIADPDIGSGNSSYVWFNQEFEAGQYTFSTLFEGTGIAGVRILFSVQVSGTSYVAAYGGYVANLSDGHITFTVSNDPKFRIGVILMTNAGHAGEPGRAYNIQLEKGNQATPYEPYRG